MGYSDHIIIGTWITMVVLALIFYVWNIVLIVRYWKNFEDWAKLLYILLLFTGVGPLPSIVLIYIGIGIK